VSDRWVVATLLFAAFGAAVSAQVPVQQEPRHHVAFENGQFRILNVNVPPGDTTLDHLHEHDLVTVSMTDGTRIRLRSTGQDWTERAPRPLGDVALNDYAGKPLTHRLENVGSSAYQLFAIEQLHPSATSGAALATDATTSLTKESRAFRVYDVRLGKAHSQASHTHAVPTVVVLLGGKVMSEGPDTQAKANAPAPVGLKQLDQPGQWLLVPAGDTHHLVRLASGDARVMEIELR